MKVWYLVGIVTVIIIVALLARSSKEGFKTKQGMVRLGNGQTFVAYNLCNGCRGKPGSQVTIDNCTCDGRKMKELTLPKSCRNYADELQYVNHGPKKMATVLCVRNNGPGDRRESDRLSWEYA